MHCAVPDGCKHRGRNRNDLQRPRDKLSRTFQAARQGDFSFMLLFRDRKKIEWNTEDNFLFEKMAARRRCHQSIAHFHLASDFTFVTTAAMRRPNRLSPCKSQAFFHSGRNVFIDQNWTGFTGRIYGFVPLLHEPFFRVYSRKYEILNAPRFFSSVFVMTHPLGSNKKKTLNAAVVALHLRALSRYVSCVSM